jgi:integral membrane protein
MGRRPSKEPLLFSIKTFRYVALAEATSFLVLLFVAYAVHSEGAVNVMGPLHGTLFLAYVVIALAVARTTGWTTRQTALVLVGAVLPFGGFVVDRWLAKTGQLETV